MDQAALETALQVILLLLTSNSLFQLHLFVLASHADLSLLGVFVIECCLLQDFIVNLAGMEFGAGANPGLQVIYA